MPTEVFLPRVDMDMKEGTISRWLAADGATVSVGDPLFEMETDKAAVEIEAAQGGVLHLAPEAATGRAIKVGTVVAWILAPGEAMAETAAPIPAEPAFTEAASAEVSSAEPMRSSPPQPGAARALPRATPLARREARAAGLRLEEISGSGPHGQITSADVMNAQAALARAPAAAPAAPTARAPLPPAPSSAARAADGAPAAIIAPHRLIPHSMMRRVIGRRLTESKQTIPHFYLSLEVALDQLLKLRADLNARSAKDGPGTFKLSVNDLIIKAAALALARFPRVNASYTEECIVEYEDVDISVAVAIPDGLITPIIRRADQKGLAAISNEMKDLAQRARSGKLKLEEFQGCGFSISNLGMFGISGFSAIINPPQAAILAIGAGEKRPVVRDGQLAIATMMRCTLSVDHRVVDGVLGAGLLTAFKGIIEDPLSLLL